MKIMVRLYVCLICIPQAACYVGTSFDIEASHLEQPVSLTSTIHNNELRILGPGDYQELSHFSISFTDWSFGSPLSSHTVKDVSDVLNNLVKQKGGDGITRLTIEASNNPVNFASMIVKGTAWFTLILGTAVLLGGDPNKTASAELIGGSLATILLMPVGGDFTIQGAIVKRNHQAAP